MKSSIVRIALAFALCAMSVGAASAKVKSKTLTVGTDFWVGGTLIKKGTYKFAYDDQTGDLSVIDKQKAVVAKAAVRAEKREHAKRGWDINLAQKGDRMSLVSLAFPEDSQTLVLGDTRAAGTGGSRSSEAGRQ